MAKRKPRSSPAPRRPTRLKPSLDFSVTGLIYCTMMMFIGLAAINVQANLLFGVFGLMIGVLLVSFLISGLVIRKLKIERVLPDQAVVGRRAMLYYNITNQKRLWPSLSVTITETDCDGVFQRCPSAYLLHVANKMTATVPAEVLPRRRGVFEFDRYQCSTSFPFGFIKRALSRRQKDGVLILPAIGRVRRDLLQRFRSAESVGDNLRPSSGGSDEFYGVKDYRPGENPRLIYWKRSARGGGLVSKEMTRVSPPRLLVLVDTQTRDRSKDEFVAIERGIASAATLIDNALEIGLPVGLVLFNGDWVSHAPNRGKQHRRSLMNDLARVKPGPLHSLDDLLEKARPLRKTDTTTVVMSPHAAATLGVAARGGQVTLSSRDPLHMRYFEFESEVDFSLGWEEGRK
jgi:uncharacterized protein (DUF58 family)